MLFDQKKELSTKRVSHNRRYATKKPSTPPGTLRLAYCQECGGYYYGSEAGHRAAFHGEPDEGNPNSP